MHIPVTIAVELYTDDVTDANQALADLMREFSEHLGALPPPLTEGNYEADSGGINYEPQVDCMEEVPVTNDSY